MAQCGALTEFTTGQTPIPSALINSNFSALRTAVNSIDQTQIDSSSTIMLSTSTKTITGVWTFTTNPVFNAGGIADSYLTSNVALLGTAQTFTGVKTFDNAIEGLRIPQLGAHPTTAAWDNALYEYTGDGNIYVYKHGTGAVRADYTGSYTGGAVRTYAGSAAIDENTPLIIPFKCDGSFTAATISLIGLDFPSWVYTELPAHTHDVGSLALASGAVSNTDHTHTTNIGHTHSGTFASSAHTHTGGGSLVTDDDGQHDHGGYTGLAARNSSTNENHNHPITAAGTHSHSFDIGTTSGPSATASVSSYAGSPTSSTPTYSTSPSVGTTISGTSASVGITGNTLNDTKKQSLTTAIKIYITQDISAGWGTGYDSGTFAALLNINAANGTGDINIFSYCASGYNYIKIVDETAKTGGTVAWHIETS